MIGHRNRRHRAALYIHNTPYSVKRSAAKFGHCYSCTDMFQIGKISIACEVSIKRQLVWVRVACALVLMHACSSHMSVHIVDTSAINEDSCNLMFG